MTHEEKLAFMDMIHREADNALSQGVVEFQACLLHLSEPERVSLIRRMINGYCIHCGRKSEKPCACVLDN